MPMSFDDVIRDLRERNQPVPKPLRLPTEAEVAAAERQLSVVFHPDYRRYLLQASDVMYGTKEPVTVTPGGGHTDLIHVAKAAWEKMGLPRNLLPICEDNGDYYCINESGEVVFWCHDGKCDESWTDVAEWIRAVWIGEG
jgi:hypothetical protein